MEVDVSDLIGKRYKPHGRGDSGYDCYGLTLEVEKRFGNILPDFEYKETDGKMEACFKETLEEGALKKIDGYVPGAIILLQNMQGMKTHIGVYIGDGMFIHSHIKRNVCVDAVKVYEYCISGVYVWHQK